MKHLMTTLALVLSMTINAQTSEATIVYSVEMETEMPEGMPADMFKNMTMTLSFKGESFRNDFNMGMMKMTTINNGEKTLSLINAMGMKYATVEDSDKSEMSLFNTNIDEDDDIDVKETGNTKTIAGYKCKEAIITSEGTQMRVYYTDKLRPKTTSKEFNMGINGFPLEFSVVASGIEMSISATSVKEKSNADFSMDIPEGYQKMNSEQLKGMMR